MNADAAAEFLIQSVGKYFPEVNTQLIRNAYEFAEKAHGLQKRSSGEPYIIHPVQVAQTLADNGPGCYACWRRRDLQAPITKLNRDVSDVQLTSTITNTLSNVRNAYWDYVFAVQSAFQLDKLEHERSDAQRENELLRNLVAKRSSATTIFNAATALGMVRPPNVTLLNAGSGADLPAPAPAQAPATPPATPPSTPPAAPAPAPAK
jgi:(p)ppGpp synthase/HD superfamily hydrolase